MCIISRQIVCDSGLFREFAKQKKREAKEVEKFAHMSPWEIDNDYPLPFKVAIVVTSVTREATHRIARNTHTSEKAMNTPSVSVIIGTHNGTKSIQRAVDSILHQTYPQIEVIICDDASTDGTERLLQELYGDDCRVTLIRNEHNCGLHVTLNRCIECTSGEFIARMDDDDYSHPTRIEKQVQFLATHSEYAFVGTSIRYFDEDGVWGLSVTPGERTLREVFCGHSFVHPTVVMRRAELLAVGMYSTDRLNVHGQDYDLWCKFYEAGYKGYCLPDTLLDYYESIRHAKRGELQSRLDHVVKTHRWRKRLHLPLRYEYYPLLTLAKCLVPQQIVMWSHKYRFGKTTQEAD